MPIEPTPAPVSGRKKFFRRRALFAIASLITIVALFYVVENWRGQRAWEAHKRELLAKGEKIDWKDFIPPLVPDDQNILKVPIVDALLNRTAKNTNDIKRLLEMCNREGAIDLSHRRSTVLAEIKILPAGSIPAATATTNPVDKIYRLDELIPAKNDQSSGFPREFGKLIGVTMLDDPAGYEIFHRKRGGPPVRINLQLEESGDRQKLEKSFAEIGFESSGDPSVLILHLPKRGMFAEDLVEWLRPFQPDLNQLAEAFKRPFAHMDEDYSEPIYIPIPNFVNARTLAQMAGAAAKAHLLLGEPEAAVRDLELVVGLIKSLKDPYLVSAMIRDAIAGLYVAVVTDGFVEGLWREPQWAALQKQMSGLELLSTVSEAFEGEQASLISVIERQPRLKLAKMFKSDEYRPVWLTRRGIYILLCPRGWLFQNELAESRFYQKFLDAFDVKRERVDPQKIQEAASMGPLTP